MPDYLVETPTHQLMFKDIDVGSKKSLYESMKLGLVKNNRNDL